MFSPNIRKKRRLCTLVSSTDILLKGLVNIISIDNNNNDIQIATKKSRTLPTENFSEDQLIRVSLEIK